jgi:hypothetical protein
MNWGGSSFWTYGAKIIQISFIIKNSMKLKKINRGNWGMLLIFLEIF